MDMNMGSADLFKDAGRRQLGVGVSAAHPQ